MLKDSDYKVRLLYEDCSIKAFESSCIYAFLFQPKNKHNKMYIKWENTIY